MPERANHFALVIGIDDYPHFRPLHGACADAQDFYDWLTDKNTGGGVPTWNAELVLSNPNPVRPVHEDVDEALERILLTARGVAAERLYVYFSGHGLARDALGADLCLAKWSNLRRAAALDSSQYLKLAMECGYFQEVVFLLDCCRIRKVGGNGLPPTLVLTPGDGAPKSTHFVAFATEYTNAAYEADTDDGAGNGQNVRGHFTTALMQALRGAAADPTGGVRASKLKEYLEVRTPEIARASRHAQEPRVINGLAAAANEPMFGSALPSILPAALHLQVGFSPGLVGEVVVEDGQVNELQRGDASTGPWRIPLAGRNLILISHGASGREKTVRVTGNEKEDIHVLF